MKSNQKGFSVVETMIIVAVIAAIGVVGWFVYQNHHKKATAPNVKTSSQSTANSYETPDKLLTVQVPTDWVSADNANAGAEPVGGEKYYSQNYYTFSPLSAYASGSHVIANPPEVIIYAYVRDDNPADGYKPWTDFLASYEQAKGAQKLTISGLDAWKIADPPTSSTQTIAYFIPHGNVAVVVAMTVKQPADPGQNDGIDNTQYVPQLNSIANSLKFN